MNHPPVQTVWVGPLTTLERVALASYVAHKHEVHLYTYAPVDAPPGVCVLDGREILPESEIFTYAGESYAGFADMFRWKLLLERGGWWVDTDTICLRALNFPADYVFSSGCTWPDGTNRPNNAAVKMPAGCPAAQYGWEECQKVDRANLRWGQIGPALAVDAVNIFDLKAFVVDWHTFCPVEGQDWHKLIDPAAAWDLTKSYAVHFWNELWRRAGQDKDAEYPAGCLYEALKECYL